MTERYCKDQKSEEGGAELSPVARRAAATCLASSRTLPCLCAPCAGPFAPPRPRPGCPSSPLGAHLGAAVIALTVEGRGVHFLCRGDGGGGGPVVTGSSRGSSSSSGAVGSAGSSRSAAAVAARRGGGGAAQRGAALPVPCVPSASHPPPIGISQFLLSYKWNALTAKNSSRMLSNVHSSGL